jgi:hypothetical protein
MKKRKTILKAMCLDVVMNLRNRLFKEQQKAAMYKKFYIDQAIECTQLKQQLRIEEHHMGFYADCMEYLCFVLPKAQNSTKADIDTIIQKFNDFRRERFMDFIKKRTELSTKQVSINGKVKTLTI